MVLKYVSPSTCVIYIYPVLYYIMYACICVINVIIYIIYVAHILLPTCVVTSSPMYPCSQTHHDPNSDHS